MNSIDQSEPAAAKQRATMERPECGPWKYSNRGGFIHFAHYSNGEIAIQIKNNFGTLEATATVNIDHPVAPTHVWLKGWGENEGLPETLSKTGILTLTGETVPVGGHDGTEAQLALLTPYGLKVLEMQNPPKPR